MSQRTERASTTAVQHRASVPGSAASIDTEVAGSDTPSVIYRELRLHGFAPDEAGNLTALLSGIRPVEGGWSLREIERLLFVRHLVERGWADEHAAS